MQIVVIGRVIAHPRSIGFDIGPSTFWSGVTGTDCSRCGLALDRLLPPPKTVGKLMRRSMEMPMRLAFVAAPLTALIGVAIWPAGPTSAAEGDLLAVSKENVNIRSGPSTNTDVLMTINPGEKIIEIAAKGEWFFVEFPDRNKRGWIFGPLLSPPNGAQPAAAAATPAPSPTPAVAAAPSAPAAVPTAPAAESAEAPTIAETPAKTVVTETADAQPAPQPEAVTQTAAIAVSDEPAAVKSFRDTVSELNDRAVSVAGINLFNDVRSTGGGGVQVLATETWARVPEAGQSSYMNALFDRWQSVANGLGPLSLQIVDPSGQVMMERSGS